MHFRTEFPVIEQKNLIQELNKTSTSAACMRSDHVEKLQKFSVEHLNQQFKQKIQDCISLFNKVTLAHQRQSSMLTKLEAATAEEEKHKAVNKRSVSEGGSTSHEPKSPAMKRKNTLPSKPPTTAKANNTVPPIADRDAVISRLKVLIIVQNCS